MVVQRQKLVCERNLILAARDGDLIGLDVRTLSGQNCMADMVSKSMHGDLVFISHDCGATRPAED